MTLLPPCAAMALAIALAACSPSNAPATPAAPTDASAARAADSTPSPVPDLLAGTGAPTTVAEPATDELAATPGSDAEDNQYFDFSGAALARIRRDARPAPPALREAARRIVDDTGRKRGCGTYPEGERLFVLDLDGQPDDEALLLYTMEGCGGGGNYYDRSGYVLREVDGAWTPVAEVPMGTRLVGNATISALEPGVVVVSPEGESLFEQQRVEIPMR